MGFWKRLRCDHEWRTVYTWLYPTEGTLSIDVCPKCTAKRWKMTP